MSSRRRVLAIAILVGMAVYSSWSAPAPEVPSSFVRPLPTPVHAPFPDPPGSPSTSFAAETWQSRADRLGERCGVDLHTRCIDDACATVVGIPDLDSLRGWAALGWSKPVLFATTLLHDVGVNPPGGWPCASAIDRFFGSPSTVTVRIGDGPGSTWVACATSSGDTESSEAPCLEAAAALGLPWIGIDPERHL